jgi:hypothetical protein
MCLSYHIKTENKIQNCGLLPLPSRCYNKKMPERFPTPEFSEEEQKLIQDLWMGEPGSEERFATLIQERQAAINSEPRPNAELSLFLAKLCVAAGAWKIALDYLLEVDMQAQQVEGAQDLFDTAGEMRKQIIEKYHPEFEESDPRFPK